jgi:tetratricopeptide (TPR) repeat protein
MVRVLDEVDQYMALGFVDDARDALRELVARHPNHPAIMAKLDELGMELDGAEPAPTSAPAELADELLGGDVEVQLEGDAEVELEVPAADEAALFGEEQEEAEERAALDDEIRFDEVSLDEEVSLDQTPLDEVPLDESPLDEAPEDLGLPAVVPAEEGRFVEEPSEAEALSAEAPEEPGIDLAAELDDLFSAQPAVDEPEPESVSSELGDSGLAEIFKEFKKGVDKQLGQEDYDTRYNLGIAYKEMGLVDEAIAEFQLAAKDERRLLECSSMLGICFLDKGMPKLAIKWFEKGLRAPGRSDEEYLGLRYDLASAHEAAGDVGTALGIFTELYGQDANFRDVASKVRELRSQA